MIWQAFLTLQKIYTKSHKTPCIHCDNLLQLTMNRNQPLGICGTSRAELTAAGVTYSPKGVHDARKQSKANGTAVMYRAPFGFRVALPQDGPGDTNLQYTGTFDEVLDELVADGYEVEVLGL
jgi:hypothetical protein